MYKPKNYVKRGLFYVPCCKFRVCKNNGKKTVKRQGKKRLEPLKTQDKRKRRKLMYGIQ